MCSLWVGLYTWGIHRGRERESWIPYSCSDSWLWTALWVLGTELFWKPVSTLNPWAISPAPLCHFPVGWVSILPAFHCLSLTSVSSPSGLWAPSTRRALCSGSARLASQHLCSAELVRCSGVHIFNSLWIIFILLLEHTEENGALQVGIFLHNSGI